MDARNREWGRGDLIDYAPFLGVAYRLYWCYVAKRGESYERDRRTPEADGGRPPSDPSDDWRRAFAGEAGRLLVALVSTVAVLVLVSLGREGFTPAILLGAGGLFVHRVLSLADVV